MSIFERLGKKIGSAASSAYNATGQAINTAGKYAGQKYETAGAAVRQTIMNVTNGARAEINKVMQGVANFAPIAQPAGYTGGHSSIRPQMPAKPASIESIAAVMQTLGGNANLTTNPVTSGSPAPYQPEFSTPTPSTRATLPPTDRYIPDTNIGSQEAEPSTIFARSYTGKIEQLAKYEADRLKMKAEEQARAQKAAEEQQRAAEAAKQTALRAGIEQAKMEARWYSEGLTVNPETGLSHAYDNDQEAHQAVRDFIAVDANNTSIRGQAAAAEYRRKQNSPLRRMIKAAAPNYYLRNYAETGNHNVPPYSVIARDFATAAKNKIQSGVSKLLSPLTKLLGKISDKYIFNADEAVKSLARDSQVTPQTQQLSSLEEANWFKEGREINPSTGHAYCHNQAAADAVATVGANRSANLIDREAKRAKKHRLERPYERFEETRHIGRQLLRTVAPNYVLRKVEETDQKAAADKNSPYRGQSPYTYAPSLGEITRDAATGLKERASKLLKGLGRGVKRAASYITGPLFNNRLADRYVFSADEAIENVSMADPKSNSVQITPPSERGKKVDQHANTVLNMSAPNSTDNSSPSGSNSDTPTLPPSGGNGGNENEPPNGDEPQNGDGPKKKAGYWEENKHLKMAFAAILAAAGATGIWVSRSNDSTQGPQVTASASASSKAADKKTVSTATPKPQTTAGLSPDAGTEDASAYVSAMPPSTGASENQSTQQIPIPTVVSAPAPTQPTPKVASAPTTTRPAPTATSKPAPRAKATPTLPPQPPKIAYNTRTTKEDPRATVNPPVVPKPEPKTPTPKTTNQPDKVSTLPPLPPKPKADPARPENEPLTLEEARKQAGNFKTIIEMLRDNAGVIYNGEAVIHNSAVDAPRTHRSKRTERVNVVRQSDKQGDRTVSRVVTTPLNSGEDMQTEKQAAEWALRYAEFLRSYMTQNTEGDKYLTLRGKCMNTNAGCPMWTTYNAEKLEGLVKWTNDTMKKHVDSTVQEGKAVSVERAENSIAQAKVAAQNVRNYEKRSALLATLATLEASLARAKSGSTPAIKLLQTIHSRAQSHIAHAEQDPTYRKPSSKNAGTGTTVSYASQVQ